LGWHYYFHRRHRHHQYLLFLLLQLNYLVLEHPLHRHRSLHYRLNLIDFHLHHHLLL
jgi:hypothetical protein